MDTFTATEVQDVLNMVLNDIEEEASLAETGAIDAMNLVLNATVHYLNHPSDRTLAAAVAANYDASCQEVISWLES